MDRRVFMHIDEYGNDGFGQLSHIICVSRPVVLWSPSALLLKSAHDAGTTDLTANDLLKLIDCMDAPVRVVARQSWFDRKWRDAHPFPGARWVPTYDDELARFAEEDRRLAPESRRVIIANPEEGYLKADALLDGPLGKSTRARVGELFRQNLLPRGTLEKAIRDRGAGRPYVRTIVRDVYNHDDAKHEARAAIAATPCEHLLVLNNVIAGTRATALTTSRDCNGTGDEHDVRDAAQVLQALRPVLDKRGLFNFLRSGLQVDLQNLLFSERGTKSLEHHLVTEMEKVIKVPSFASRFLPNRDPIGSTVTLGGLALALASIILTSKPTFGLLPVAVAALKGPAMRHGLLPAPIPWGHETRALFYLALGKRRPTIKRVKALCEWLA